MCFSVLLHPLLYAPPLFSYHFLSSLMLAKETAASELTSEGGSVVVPPMPTSLVNGAEVRLAMLCNMHGEGGGKHRGFLTSSSSHTPLFHFCYCPQRPGDGT
jgi:hypothetical protein